MVFGFPGSFSHWKGTETMVWWTGEVVIFDIGENRGSFDIIDSGFDFGFGFGFDSGVSIRAFVCGGERGECSGRDNWRICVWWYAEGLHPFFFLFLRVIYSLFDFKISVVLVDFTFI